MPTPLFELHDAIVRRSGKVILHVDDLSLYEGEAVAILGPNGSGKSTFANLLTREALPLHQETPPVRFRGNARATLAEVKSQVGFVSSAMQNQISVHLPAVDIVEGGLFGSLGRPMRISVSREQHGQAMAVMEELGIQTLADRDVTTLSSGQARRVLIARALVHNPSVLIFDEPCTGLDPEGMYYVREAMSRVIVSERTVVLVTHYPDDIVGGIKRVLLLKEGRIVDDGTKAQMLTGKRLSALFDVPIAVYEHEGTYSIAFVRS